MRRCCCHGSPPCSPIICVTGCPSGTELVGATVTVKSGGTTLFTGTTVDDGHGSACVGTGLTGSGTYEVIVSATGYVTYDATRELDCGDTYTIALQPNSVSPTIKFAVTGCCSLALPDAEVTLTGPDGDEFTCTTDSSGQCTFTVGEGGTYNYSIDKDRFTTATGSTTISQCQTTTTTINVTLSPAAGYVCGPDKDQLGNPRPDPIPTTLNLTDSLYGSCTLTWDATNLWWWGENTGASFSAACGCPAATFTIGYTIWPCGGTIGATFFGIDYSSCNYGECFPPSIVFQGENCPSASTITSNNPCPHTGGTSETYAGCAPANPGVTPGTAGFSYSLSSPTNVDGTWSMATGIPFDLTITTFACNCKVGGPFLGPYECNSGTAPQPVYNSSATITVTE